MVGDDFVIIVRWLLLALVRHIDRISGRNVVGLEVSGIARKVVQVLDSRPSLALREASAHGASLSTFGGEASGSTPVIRTRGDRNQLFHP